MRKRVELILIFISILSSFKVESQEPKSNAFGSLCELSKVDTSAFLERIEKIETRRIPFDLLAHAAILHRDFGSLVQSDFYFQQALKTENERTFSSASECYLGYSETELMRAYRKVLMELKQYDKALEVIGQDKLTFGDIHSSGGNSRCVKHWIKSEQATDSSLCYIGKNEKDKAISILLYDAFFEQECFDSEGHFKALFSIFDSSYVYKEITQAFANPICYEFSLGEAPNDLTFTGFKMVLFGDTIKTRFTTSDYNSCDEVPKSLKDSLIQVYDQSYYLRNLKQIMKE